MKLLASFERVIKDGDFSCAYDVDVYAQGVECFNVRENEGSQYEKKIKEILDDTSSLPVYSVLHNMHESLRWKHTKHPVPITLQAGITIVRARNENWSYMHEMQSSDKKFLATFKNFDIGKDGTLVTFAKFDSSNLDLWNVRGEHIATLDKHTDDIWDVICLDNGNILSYSCDNTLRLWSNKGDQLALFEGHTDSVRGAKVLPDGRILSFSNDWSIRIWSADGKPLKVLKEHTSIISNVLILNDGRFVSYAYSISNIVKKEYSNDGRVLIWSSDGELLRTLEVFIDHVDGVKLLSDDKILAYSDRSLSVYDNSGNDIASAPYGQQYEIISAQELGNGNTVTLGVRGDRSDMKVWGFN